MEMEEAMKAQAKTRSGKPNNVNGKKPRLSAVKAPREGDYHVKDIGLVVNYEFPYEPEDYVHRIGRTGRAGVAGTAISFACEDESFTIPAIEEYIGEDLRCTMPEEELLTPVPRAR